MATHPLKLVGIQETGSIGRQLKATVTPPGSSISFGFKKTSSKHHIIAQNLPIGGNVQAVVKKNSPALLRLFLAAAALTCFILFLSRPAYVDSVNGNGQKTMRPGWTQLFWDSLMLSHILELGRAEECKAMCVSLPTLLAEAGFCLLPFLHFKRFLGHRWPQFFLAGVFVAGGISFGWLVRYDIKMEYGVGRGVYFWLAAAVCALIYCLLSAVVQGGQAGKAILKN